MDEKSEPNEPDLTHAPWTDEEVDALNIWQASPNVHPFTCPNRGDGSHEEVEGEDLGQLLATEDGWVCLDCDYEQKWAHAFMLQLPPNLWGDPGVGLVVGTESEAAQDEIADLEALWDSSDQELLPFARAHTMSVSVLDMGEEIGMVRVRFEAQGGDIDGRSFCIDLSRPMFYSLTIASVRLCRTFADDA